MKRPVYKNQNSGPQPLGHGIRGVRKFIPKWPRSYVKDLENSRNFLASRAVPVSACFRLLHHHHHHCTFFPPFICGQISVTNPFLIFMKFLARFLHEVVEQA
jgi:hypothetical protein